MMYEKCSICKRPKATKEDGARHDAEWSDECPSQIEGKECWCNDLCWLLFSGHVCPHWLDPVV